MAILKDPNLQRGQLPKGRLLRANELAGRPKLGRRATFCMRSFLDHTLVSSHSLGALARNAGRAILRSEYELNWYQILIDQLRAARLAAGLSQRALAELLDIDAQAIKRMEKGIGAVPTLLAVMKALSFRLTGVGAGATLPEQLRGRRLQRGISLDQVAAMTGLSRTTIASLERGGGSVTSLLRLLEAIAPNARRRSPERSYWGYAGELDRDSRFTPPDFMNGIYSAFGEVDLDPCGHVQSPVIARRRILLSEGGDGLVDNWSGKLAFVNPPFSAMLQWLRRAYDQWHAGNVETVVFLAPVRTDSAWFHDTLSAVADIYLLRGRVRFLKADGKGQHTPFSLMVVTLGTTAEQRRLFAEAVPGFWLERRDAI